MLNSKVGATVAEGFQDEMRVTVIATGFDQTLSGAVQPKAAVAAPAPEAAPAEDDIDAPVAAAAKPSKPADVSDIDEIFSIFRR